MDKKSIKESADIIYRICSKNGDNRLTGYFSSSPTNMWLNSEDNLELKCVVREKNTIFETIGTVLDNSVIMKQIQKKEKETYYDLISWTASGEECTVVNLNNLEDLDKAYKDIAEKQKVFVGLTNIEKIFSDLDIKYNSINYIKTDDIKKKNKKTNKITAQSLVDELEYTHQKEEQEKDASYKVG